MQFPVSQCAAVPSCGAQPFNTYQAAFDNTLNQFDWNFLHRINPETIEATQDSESLEKIIYSFADSQFGPVERQFLPFPSSAKFYRTLQLGVDYLLKKQAKLQRQLKQKDNEIQYLTHKLQKSVECLDRMPRNTISEVSIAHSCPVCSRAFKALFYLDKHIVKCHPEQIDAWKALREGQPYGVSKAFAELHQDIDHLRACITRQGYEERREILRNDPNVGKFPGPGPQPAPKPVATSTTGKIVETKEIKPMAYRRNFPGDPTEPKKPAISISESESGGSSYPSSVSFADDL